MTRCAERRVRIWLAVAAVLAQLSAAGAGLLRGSLLLVTVGAIVATTWFIGERSRRWRLGGYVLAAAVVLNAARQLADRPDAATSAGLSSSLSTLTLTLVLLSVVLAPTWHRPRDYRLWLAMSASVTVAACATGSGQVEAGILIATWLVLLIAAGVLQSWALMNTATVVVTADEPTGWARNARRVLPIGLSVALGGLVFAAAPGGLGGGNLPVRLVHYVHPPATFSPTRGVFGVDTMGTGILDLRVRGALPTTPLLLVPSDAPPLWRGTVYRDYTGHDWRAAPGKGPEQRLIRGTDVRLPATADDPVPVGVTRSDLVHREPGMASSLAWSPGVIRRVQADIFGAFPVQGALRLFGSRGDDSYTVTSVVAQRAPGALQHASGPDVVDKSWTALPAELPQRVTDLAGRITAGAPNRYAQVQAIQAFLRSHETYALNSPVPAANEDAVDRFLFHDHVGFCEQFASAEAVMLRAIDVPARVVSGLAYGHQQSDGTLFTEADAHAWVEVYYPGIGWSPTDPTAGVRLASGQSQKAGLLAAHGLALIVGLTTLILLTIAGLVIRRRRRARSSALPSGPILRAFVGFVRRARQPLKPAETAREYLDRHTVTTVVAEALDALETECYGADHPSPARTAHAVQIFAGSRPVGDRFPPTP